MMRLFSALTSEKTLKIFLIVKVVSLVISIVFFLVFVPFLISGISQNNENRARIEKEREEMKAEIATFEEEFEKRQDYIRSFDIDSYDFENGDSWFSDFDE